MNLIELIVEWYQENKRDLPWRNTTDPYVIWLSEIILQQTRVEQGMPYFHRFLESYPTVSEFASATEDEILNHWQGLGYYSRGRNMHKTANIVMEEHAGYFPKRYDDLIKLKGIGEYTAAAISSFSDNEVRAVVDGNVFRVLARYFGIDDPINSPQGKKLFTLVANDIIDKSDPATSNQALMEFGSLQCRPRNPLCQTCPLILNCVAFQQKRIDSLPVKLKTNKVRNRYFNYLVLIQNGKILLNKRGANDIWQNLHDLPLIETSSFEDPDQILNNEESVKVLGAVRLKEIQGPITHILSHQKIQTRFLVIETDSNLPTTNNGWFFTDLSNLKDLAQPKLIFAFLQKFLS